MALPEVRSGLLVVVDSVRAYFEKHELSAKVVIGSRERTKQNNQGPRGADRVVFQPWADNGKGGTIAVVKNAGPREYKNEEGETVGTVRALKEWQRQISVYCWAVDPDDPKDEEKQIIATDQLLVWTTRALYYAGFAAIDLGDVTWTTSPNEVVFGREASFSVTISQPILDLPNELVTATPKVNRPEP